MNTRVALVVLLALLAIVLIAGSGLIYWMTVYQPSQYYAQATATTRANATASSSRSHLASLASANATATVVAQATSSIASTQIALGDFYNQALTGNPALNDSLNSQNGDNWDVNQFDTSSCGFAKGMYDSTAKSGYINACTAKSTNFANLAFQAEMNIVSGHSGGIVVHADTKYSGYYFRLSTDGTVLGRRVTVDAQNVANYTALFAGLSTAANKGNNQFNTITVIVRSGDIYMYVNQRFVFKASDSTYKSGSIGVFSDSDASNSEILFRNAQVWKL